MQDDLGVKEEEVQLPDDSPTSNETTEEVSTVADQEASETEAVETETAESNKGANQRIRELNAKAKAEARAKEEALAKVQSLSDQIAELTKPIGLPTTDSLNYPQYEDGQMLTPEQIRADVSKTAEAKIEIRLAQERAINNHNLSSEKAMQKYPELDPDSDTFNPELSDSVAESVKALIKAEPYTADVLKHVDKLMKPYKRAVAKEVGQETANIAKQVTESALRPTSIRKEEKTAIDKSVEELEQELGIVYS